VVIRAPSGRLSGRKSPCSANAYLLAFVDDTNEPQPWDALISQFRFLPLWEEGLLGIAAKLMDEPGSVADA
jgi:hypothetical protein